MSLECFLNVSIVYRKITWSGRLAQIQSYLKYFRVLSRDQSKCKENKSVVHEVSRKEKDVNQYVNFLYFNNFIHNLLNYSSSLRAIILHYAWCKLCFPRMHCFKNNKISLYWNISNPNERRLFRL